MLAAVAEAFLGHGGDKLAVAQHARGSIRMKGIEPDDQHGKIMMAVSR
jgi:hypothetical protein